MFMYNHAGHVINYQYVTAGRCIRIANEILAFISENRSWNGFDQNFTRLHASMGDYRQDSCMTMP